LAGTQNASNGSTSGPSEMSRALARFLRNYPGFAKTGALDVLRTKEYARLDEQGHTYLDYTGGGLYAESQLRQHQELLTGAVFGNPHSHHEASRPMNERIEATRVQILEFFHAAPEEYEVIFTPNATGALRLVGESYPFGPDGHYLLTLDNHNSVNGIGEFAKAKGAPVSYVALGAPELRVPGDALAQHFSHSAPSALPRFETPDRRTARRRRGGHHLFAYPAQSNFSGVQHELKWIPQAQEAGWDVLLDAAAFVPTNRLDLSRWHPDYVALSFYKIFGYPTGIGALLVRRSALAKLRRPWYAGGTLTFSSVHTAAATGGSCYRTPGAAGFEDGTLDYLGIPAIGIGLRYIDSIGIETIHNRVMCLAGWLLEALAAIRHSNGGPVVRIYGPRDTQARGGTISMNFTAHSGKLIDSRRVEQCASAAGIFLRSGCQCNPGARGIALGLFEEKTVGQSQCKNQVGYEQLLDGADGKEIGAVRASIGLVTTFADVYRFWEFARGFRDAERETLDYLDA
jgi:molybdenum cofactor sulfurtransferase